MLKLRMVDLTFPRRLDADAEGAAPWCAGRAQDSGRTTIGHLLMGPMRPEVGLAPVEYAKIAYDALLAGSDIVKDDELLVDPPYCPIPERATLCVKSAREAEQKTGERKMWVLHLGCDVSRFDEFLKIGAETGSRRLHGAATAHTQPADPDAQSHGPCRSLPTTRC